MPTQVYTKAERKAQFLETGLKIAKKVGLNKLTATAVALQHNVAPTHVFWIFKNRDGLRQAIKQEAKKQKIDLDVGKKAAPAKKTPAKKTPVKKTPVKKTAKKTAKKAAKKFATQPVPSVQIPKMEVPST